MSEVNNRMSSAAGVLENTGEGSLTPPPEPKKTKLNSEQSLAAHLLQEREERQAAILEMNELLKEVDEQGARIVQLKRALYQERLNSIAKDNADLRSKYELPNGNVHYIIEDGDMYVVEGAPPQQ